MSSRGNKTASAINCPSKPADTVCLPRAQEAGKADKVVTATINGGGSQAIGFVAGTNAENNQQIVNGDHNYVVGTNLHRFVYTVRANAQHRRDRLHAQRVDITPADK